MAEDEDTPTGDNPVPSPDPADRPWPCKDPWTWRKGAEWKKGHAANPSGVNGSTYRNKAAQAAANLFDGEAEHLSRRCVELALAGDIGAMKICVERILPPRRGRPFKFKPTLRTIADAQATLATLAAGVTKGEILIDEALAVTEIVNAFSKTAEIAEFESRLVALEKAPCVRCSCAGSQLSRRRTGSRTARPKPSASISSRATERRSSRRWRGPRIATSSASGAKARTNGSFEPALMLNVSPSIRARCKF
jgi:hypothetical protein